MGLKQIEMCNCVPVMQVEIVFGTFEDGKMHDMVMRNPGRHAFQKLLQNGRLDQFFLGCACDYDTEIFGQLHCISYGSVDLTSVKCFFSFGGYNANDTRKQ